MEYQQTYAGRKGGISMRGYIYKDYKVTTMALVIIGVLASFLIWAIIVSSSDADVGMREKQMMVLYFLGIINFISPLISVFTCYEADKKEKFIQFAAAMPGGIKRYIQSKYMYIYSLIVMVIIFSYGVASCYDLSIGEVSTLKSLHWILFAVVGMGLIACSIHFPLAYRFGSGIGNMTGTVLIVGTLIGFYIYMMFGDISKFDDNLWKNVLNWILKNEDSIKYVVSIIFAIGVGSTCISCWLSEKACIKGAINQD